MHITIFISLTLFVCGMQALKDTNWFRLNNWRINAKLGILEVYKFQIHLLLKVSIFTFQVAGWPLYKRLIEGFHSAIKILYLASKLTLPRLDFISLLQFSIVSSTKPRKFKSTMAPSITQMHVKI